MENMFFAHTIRRRGAGVLRCAAALAMAITLVLRMSSGMASALPTYEGPGLATPEDAAHAYLEAAQNGDLSQMLAAFAIESYVDNYDFLAQLNRLKVYAPSLPVRLPNANPLLRDINVETRKAEVVDGIIYQLLAFHMPEMTLTAPVVFTGDDAAAHASRFAADMATNMHVLTLSSLEIGGFIPPELLSDAYTDEKNREHMDGYRQMIGADEMRSVAVKFSVGENPYILCCDAVRYGDAWFLVQLGGNIGNLLNAGRFVGGILPAQ